jgi:formamidopyrimidine-DNA glycosylase
MPEAPEVETVRRTLSSSLLGKQITRIRQSRFPLRTPVPTRVFRFLIGETITRLKRHGKMLWIETSSSSGFIVRLGMSGRLLFESTRSKQAQHTHVVFSLGGGFQELRYVDPRRFGEIVPFMTRDVLEHQKSRLGPDVLKVLQKRNQAKIADYFCRTSRCIKDVLLDQTCIAGLGNIYACEALFAARISPYLPANQLSPEEIHRLLEAILLINRDAISHGGTTFSDFRDGHGGKGQHQDFLTVFQRENEPCPRCETQIVRQTHRGRSNFICPSCQNTS